jgi:hypothetical protein
MAPKINKNSLSLFFLIVYLFLHNVNAGGHSYSPPNETAVCLIIVPNSVPPERSDDSLSNYLLKFTAPLTFQYFTKPKPNHFTALQTGQPEYNSPACTFSLIISQTLYKKNISHFFSEGDAELSSSI